LQDLCKWLVDLSVVQLFEEKKLRKPDFVVTENYHIWLKEQAAKALIEKIKLNMNAKAAFKGRNATYQTILYRNIQTLTNFVISKSKQLDFDIPAVILKRNDSLDVQQRILAMMPDERKRLGISKSGLWYQKRKLANGEPVKVYRKTLPKYR
jgi:CRISPR-associated protein Cas1